MRKRQENPDRNGTRTKNNGNDNEDDINGNSASYELSENTRCKNVEMNN